MVLRATWKLFNARRGYWSENIMLSLVYHQLDFKKVYYRLITLCWKSYTKRINQPYNSVCMYNVWTRNWEIYIFVCSIISKIWNQSVNQSINHNHNHNHNQSRININCTERFKKNKIILFTVESINSDPKRTLVHNIDCFYMEKYTLLNKFCISYNYHLVSLFGPSDKSHHHVVCAYFYLVRIRYLAWL